MKQLRVIGLVLLAAVVLTVLSGCTTTDSENVSTRPWNSPQGWEHGLPTGINEGR